MTKRKIERSEVRWLAKGAIENKGEGAEHLKLLSQKRPNGKPKTSDGFYVLDYIKDAEGKLELARVIGPYQSLQDLPPRSNYVGTSILSPRLADDPPADRTPAKANLRQSTT